MTAITNKILRDKIMNKTPLELKKINRIDQTEYIQKEKQKNTIPEALISTREKHITKEELIQRMKRVGTIPKNKSSGNRKCRFCNAPNWTPIHKCPALEANCTKSGKKGQYAKACKQKFSNNRTVKRLTEEETSEPDEPTSNSDESIHHIREIKKINEMSNHFTAVVQTNGIKKQFIIDTGSPFSKMPPDEKIMKSTEMQKTTNRYQDVKK